MATVLSALTCGCVIWALACTSLLYRHRWTVFMRSVSVHVPAVCAASHLEAPLCALCFVRDATALTPRSLHVVPALTFAPASCDLCFVCTVVRLSFHPTARKRMHALKGLACRKRVAAATSPAATCKQDAALTSPTRHACGCAGPLCARFCHKSSKILSDWSKT
jgi:hypothetical protein